MKEAGPSGIQVPSKSMKRKEPSERAAAKKGREKTKELIRAEEKKKAHKQKKTEKDDDSDDNLPPIVVHTPGSSKGAEILKEMQKKSTRGLSAESDDPKVLLEETLPGSERSEELDLHISSEDSGSATASFYQPDSSPDSDAEQEEEEHVQVTSIFFHNDTTMKVLGKKK